VPGISVCRHSWVNLIGISNKRLTRAAQAYLGKDMRFRHRSGIAAPASLIAFHSAQHFTHRISGSTDACLAHCPMQGHGKAAIMAANVHMFFQHLYYSVAEALPHGPGPQLHSCILVKESGC
jgi:hypothetical protein